MAEPIWTTIITSAIPTIIAIGTIFLTRERSNAVDHLKLVNLERDVQSLKGTVADQAATIAQHNILHRKSGEWEDKIEGKVDEITSKVDQSIGREDGRRHQQR